MLFTFFVFAFVNKKGIMGRDIHLSVRVLVLLPTCPFACSFQPSNGSVLNLKGGLPKIRGPPFKLIPNYPPFLVTNTTGSIVPQSRVRSSLSSSYYSPVGSFFWASALETQDARARPQITEYTQVQNTLWARHVRLFVRGFVLFKHRTGLNKFGDIERGEAVLISSQNTSHPPDYSPHSIVPVLPAVIPALTFFCQWS